MRKMAVLNLSASKYASFVDYSYDTEKELWCDLTLAFSTDQKNVDMSNVIRRAAEKAVIREVKNISRAFLIENLKGKEGCNRGHGLSTAIKLGSLEKTIGASFIALWCVHCTY